MKKMISLILAAAMALCLMTGCGSKAESGDDTRKVAIIKLMDHASLDEIANAIGARFDAIAAEKNCKISTRFMPYLRSSSSPASTLPRSGQSSSRKLTVL